MCTCGRAHTGQTRGRLFHEADRAIGGPAIPSGPVSPCSRLGQGPSEVEGQSQAHSPLGRARAEPWPVGKPAKPFGTGGSGPPTGTGSGPIAQQAGLGPPLLEKLPLQISGCHFLGPLCFPHGASYLEPPFLTYLRPHHTSPSHTLGKTPSLCRFPQEISSCSPTPSLPSLSPHP